MSTQLTEPTGCHSGIGRVVRVRLIVDHVLGFPEMKGKVAGLCFLTTLHLGTALGAASVDSDSLTTYAEVGRMLIGGTEGLAHEFKYIQQPHQELPDFTFLPPGCQD